MKLQEIFNTVWNGLKSQGFEQSLVDGNTCVYRGDAGRKCAAGWLLPDEEWSKTFNAKRIAQVPFFNNNFNIDELDLIFRLQTAHDFAYSPHDMKIRLLSVAEHHKLDIPND